jgi:hypothetical protein
MRIFLLLWRGRLTFLRSCTSGTLTSFTSHCSKKRSLKPKVFKKQYKMIALGLEAGKTALLLLCG